MPPMTPGRIAPGVDSSKMRPSVPSIIKTYATFGSVITASTRSRKPISIGLATASRVASVTGPCDVFTVRPSSFVSRSGMESAMKSTTFSRTASRSVTDTDWRTAFSPHSALRPRSMAIVRMNAAASFSTLRMLSLSMLPPTDTGWAAPMFVAGAMAATWAAMVMKTPAEAARAPVGPTHTTTGISALSRRWQIARIERSRPPGVSSWITSACAPSAFARAIALSTSRSVTGLMTPSTTTVATGAGAAHAGAARRTSRVRTNRPRRRRVIVSCWGPRHGPQTPSARTRPGRAVARLGVDAGWFTFSWGPRNGPQTPTARTRPGRAVARLGVDAGWFTFSWGPRNGPQTPTARTRPGRAVARLGVDAGWFTFSWGPRNGPQTPTARTRPGRAVARLGVDAGWFTFSWGPRNGPQTPTARTRPGRAVARLGVDAGWFTFSWGPRNGPQTPTARTRPGRAVARLGVDAGWFTFSWGPRNGPQTPTARTRPGRAVARLGVDAGCLTGAPRRAASPAAAARVPRRRSRARGALPRPRETRMSAPTPRSRAS